MGRGFVADQIHLLVKSQMFSQSWHHPNGDGSHKNVLLIVISSLVLSWSNAVSYLGKHTDFNENIPGFWVSLLFHTTKAKLTVVKEEN